MKNFTKEEFVDYVKTLQFEELEDIGAFIQEYFNYYEKIPNENKEEKDEAWAKVMILLARYGMTFVSFGMVVIDFRKHLNEEIRLEEENRDSGSLESGTN
jgi:hypothetical protein